MASFYGNKRWTFSVTGKSRSLFPRYVSIQIAGYVTNLGLLILFHKRLGFPHQAVQLVSIALVACELYLLSKYYVFRPIKSEELQ